MLAVGFCGGIGFVVAHELIHRRERWLRGLGLLVLSTTNYMHFRVEHVFGHHRNVGTDDDPATARFNESIYAFWWRCIPDSYVSALKFEMRRCGSRYFHRKNRMLHYFIVQLFTNGLVYMVWGLKGLLFFLAQSFIAILLLETINYVEHYGLKRSLLPDHKEISDQAERNPSPGGPNRAGPFSPELSWDSPHYFTNAFLFNLGMHAQHHISPSTHYEGLKVHKDAAILPFGYSMMLIMAMVPPLWRGVMNKKLRELGYAV